MSVRVANIFGPRYRVYFGKEGDNVILLWGGKKQRQEKDVARAKSCWTDYARTCKLNRESLYRMLSKKGNPSLQSLGKLLLSLGFRLAIEGKDAA